MKWWIREWMKIPLKVFLESWVSPDSCCLTSYLTKPSQVVAPLVLILGILSIGGEKSFMLSSRGGWFELLKLFANTI